MASGISSYRNKAILATLIALGGNFTLGAGKIGIGILISSISLIADGFDSFIDIFMALLAFAGAILAQKPADENHPYGHEKIEMIVVLGLTILIGFSGFNLIMQAINNLVQGIQLNFSLLGFLTILIAIAGKITIAFCVLRISNQINSPSLKATALNYTTDVISSIFVVLSFVLSLIDLGLFDSIAAIGICLLIFYGAYQILMNALQILLDRAPEKETLDQILTIASGVEGVKDAYNLRARTLGSRIIGDMKVLVDPEISVRQGHAISEQVFSVLQEINVYLSIHIEPFSDD